MAIKITKIELDIEGEIISLSVQQAKELKMALSDVFREPEVTTIPWYVGFTERPDWYPLTYWTTTQNGSTLIIGQADQDSGYTYTDGFAKW